MKTRKHNLNAIALGVALAMGSLPVLAQTTNPPVENPAVEGARSIIAAERASVPPTFNTNEKVGLCLLESVVSLLASRTNDFTCDNAKYSLSVYTDSPTTGVAELDLGVDRGGTTLAATLNTRDIGARCKVDEAYGRNLLKGLEVHKYDGDHGWSRTSEIFNSDAYIKLVDPQTGSYNKYREVNIKDYFKRVIDGKAWEFDWGLEDIKKFRYSSLETMSEDRVNYKNGFYYPVQKWQEASWYSHENGQEGGLWVRKSLVIPRSAYGCQIKVQADDLFNGSGEFEMNGSVKVGRFPVDFGQVTPN